MAEDRDAARKGKAIEYLVAATCILVSDLRLNVSTSLVDDEGVDLVFHRRDRPVTLGVQVKGRLMSAKTIASGGRFQASVRASTFRARDDLAILFVAVDGETAHSSPHGSFRASISPRRQRRALGAGIVSQLPPRQKRGTSGGGIDARARSCRVGS
jgi:hypothetical protein